MKISTCCKTYEVEEKESDEPRVVIQVSAPGSDRFFKFNAVVDTGCGDAIVIPRVLVRELGIDFLNNGQEESSTANGVVSTIESLADVKIICSSGRPITFHGIEISIDEKLDEVLVGINILKYFRMHFENGKVRSLEFNDRSF